MLNRKDTIIHLIVEMIKKTVKMSEYFLEPKSSTENINVKLDLSRYATKADLKNATGVDASTFAKKNGLAN